MDRVTAPSLPLADVARFWAREQNAVYTDEEIVEILVQAVWRGDLIAEPPTGPVSRGGDYRYSLLKAVAAVRNHPGLLFVRPDEPVGPVEETLPSGDTLVDLRTRIQWVSDGVDPDEATTATAFAVLASADLDAYDDATVLPILRTLPIDREAIRGYCKTAGQSLPSFWFERDASRTSVAAVTRCRTWLETLVSAGEYPGTKAEVRAIAMRKFKGLSARAFDRTWDEKAPTAWKRAGRRTGSLRRTRAAP